MKWSRRSEAAGQSRWRRAAVGGNSMVLKMGGMGNARLVLLQFSGAPSMIMYATP